MKNLIGLSALVLCSFALVVSIKSLGAETKTKTANFSALQGLGNPDYHEVKSLDGKRNYHIFVRTPVDDGSKTLYPTVYLLDGGVTFPLLSSLYHFMRYTEETPKMNIVGISYGADTFKQGNYRSSDFTAKSSEREYWGGAGEFSEFFEKRLIPLIEKSYPADPKQRIIFGQSLGGQFVIYTAMHKPKLFNGYIASNPALHRNLDLFVQPLKTNKTTKAINKPKLYVGMGSEDHPTYQKPALKWLKYVQSYQGEQLPWIFKNEIFPGQTHVSAASEAFRHGTAWLLKE